MDITRVTELLDGIKVLSLVENPATQDNINWCSWEYCGIDIERRTIKSKIMVPLQKVYRKDPERFYYFPTEVVKNEVQKLIENTVEFSLDHGTDKVDGIVLVEAYATDVWMEDTVRGTAFVVLRVDSDEIWDDVLQGKYKGISLEATAREELIATIPDDPTLAMEVIENLPQAIQAEVFAEFEEKEKEEPVRSN